MELWTAFTIGLVGSLHCVGMCGAIALALPHSGAKRWKYLAGRLLYNFGRIATYSLLGIFFGIMGRAVSLAGFQEKLSISLGVIILIVLVMPNKYSAKILTIPILSRIIGLLRVKIGRLFGNGSLPALFSIGILNGLLPCGFVYVGIAGSLTTNSLIEGATYMALFGLGTLPTMLATSLASNFVSFNVRNTLRRFLPVGTAILATLFILRGLALGIPYISPKLSKTPTINSDCCSGK